MTHTHNAWAELTPAEKRAIVKARQGEPASAIARAYGTTRDAVLGFRRRQGMGTLARVLRAQGKATKATRLEAATRMLAERHDVQDVAATLGVATGTLRNLLREAGQPLNLTRMRTSFPVYPQPPAETWLPIPGPSPMQGDGGCQWPIEIEGVRQGPCGHAVHRRSYCERHFAMAYSEQPIGAPSSVKPKVAYVRPISSLAAMRITGAAARRVEILD